MRVTNVENDNDNDEINRTYQMTNELYCKLCDETINKKRKSKQNKTRTHKQNEKMIIYKYHIEKPDLKKKKK